MLKRGEIGGIVKAIVVLLIIILALGLFYLIVINRVNKIV